MIPEEKTMIDTDNIERIRRRVVSLGGLPTLPEVATKVMTLAQNPETSIQDIGKVVQTDPSLAGRILKVANSAYYGLSNQVGSLNLALVLLGMKNIITIVTSVSIFQAFKAQPGTAGFSRKEFWSHSGACAKASELLCKELGLSFDGEAFVCGLMHDIGKIVMDVVFHEDFVEVVRIAERDSIPMYKAEEEVLGITHAMIGKWVAEKWKFPEPILHAISSHHSEPFDPGQDSLCAVLQLADMLVKIKGYGFCGFEPLPEFHELDKWPVCSGRTIDWDAFLGDLDSEYEEVQDFLNAAGA